MVHRQNGGTHGRYQCAVVLLCARVGSRICAGSDLTRYFFAESCFGGPLTRADSGH